MAEHLYKDDVNYLNPQEMMVLDSIKHHFEIHYRVGSTKRVNQKQVSPELLEVIIMRYGYRVHINDQKKKYVIEKIR